MKSSNLVPVLSFAAIVLFLFAACGGSSPSSNNDAGATDTDTDTDSDADSDSDSDSDSDGDTDTNCAEVDFQIAGVNVDMLVVLDRSNSMCNQNLWSDMADAVSDIAQQMSSQVNFGLMLFPSLTCTNSPVYNQCGSPSAPSVPFTATDPVGDIVDLLGPNDVGCCGGTPTSDSLNTATSYLDTVSDGLEKFILLATDGAPACNPSLDGSSCTCVASSNNCSQPGMNLNCLDDSNTYAAAAAADSAGYPVYVLGIGDSLSWQSVMDEIANQGGTLSSYSAGDTTQFLSTLQQIVGDVISCEFDIDWTSLPDNASQDPNMVNFYGDGVVIPFDEDCAAGEGWNWLDNDTVEFCAQSCADLKAATWTTVTAGFGCETVNVIE